MKTKLPNIENLIAKEIGTIGTPQREEHFENALAQNYAALLRERRKDLHITQIELAQRVGKQRSYIARLERGQVDMQLSTLLSICSALGLKLNLC